jgi:hypothetical protein
MLDKMKSFLEDIGVCENDMIGLDEDELCELAIHLLMPSDLTEMFEVVNN